MGDRWGLRLRHVEWSAGLALLFFVTAGLTEAWAYDEPPARAARLSYLQGNVTVVRMDNTGSDPAQLNMPLTEGLRVMTGQNGQAEIEFEDGSLVRLTPNSSLALDGLRVSGDGSFQTQLALVRGLVYAELRAASKYTYRLSVDGAVVSPVENATVRVDMDQPPAVIAVLSGRVHVEGGSRSAEGYRGDVSAGEALTADSSGAGRYFLSQEIPEESWDSWNEQRDQVAADEVARRTAARDNYAGDAGYGWSDLDANGRWYDVPGQGRVWQPDVAMYGDFDPYGYGSWVWYPSAGYVWASGYGWGWTPYRCGNWSFWGGFGWGWIPGSNCGLAGWGFGGGYVINVVHAPRDYRPIPLPIRSPGGVHPILVKPGHGPAKSLHPMEGPRTIEGHKLEPLRPIGGGYTFRGGSAIGSSLHKDFPVDRGTHQAVMGVVTAPVDRPVTRPAPGWRSGGSKIENGVQVSPVQPVRPGSSVDQRLGGVQGIHPSQGARDLNRSTPRIAPPVQTIAPPSPASQSRPAEPNPVARPITPQQPYQAPRQQPYQAPRSMPPPQRSEPMQRPAPSPQPQHSAPASRPTPNAPAPR